MSGAGVRDEGELLPGLPLKNTDTICVWYGHVMGDGKYDIETDPPLPPLYIKLSKEDMESTPAEGVAAMFAQALAEDLLENPTFRDMLARWIESKR